MLPAKDEAVGIGKTLKSILQAGVLPADIYVIDDGSSDGTGEIARSFDVNVVRNPKNIGKAHSLAPPGFRFRFGPRATTTSA